MQRITDDLVTDLGALTFGPGVTCVYNPLVYARAGWDAYLARAGEAKGRVLLLGMNPGPFGMAQIGVPFGDPAIVREWLGIDVRIPPPDNCHPRRPVLGFASPRTEVSGSRVWNWARDRFGTPQAFFDHFFIGNYCPLCFLEASGRNLTPDKLQRAEREALFAVCDAALRRMVLVLQPSHIVGFGNFAEARARKVAGDLGIPIGRILHPSPASPAANSGWERQVDAQLRAMGISVV